MEMHLRKLFSAYANQVELRDAGNGKVILPAIGETMVRAYINLKSELHRDKDKPAVSYYHTGGYCSTEIWMENGLIHRENAPAVISHGGTFLPLSIKYYRRGQMHRDHGPASIELGVYGEPERLEYVQEGLKHRVDGAAVQQWDVGRLTKDEYWVKGEMMTKEQMREMKPNLRF